MIEISVIVPVFNVQLYIGEFVESLNAQTIAKDRFEVIFVDDCSTDASCETIERTAAADLNYSLLKLDTPSHAPGKPRNIGIERTSAPYIVFYDPDDVIPDYALEVKLRLIKAYGSEVLSGLFTRFTTTGDCSLGPDFGDSPVWPEINLDASTTRHGVTSAPALWSRIFSRDFIESSGITYLEGVISQDASFMFDVYDKASRMSFVPIVFCHYRVRQETDNPSISQTLEPRYFADILFTRKYMFDRNPGLYQQRKEKDLRIVIRFLARSGNDVEQIRSSMKEIRGLFEYIDIQTGDVPGLFRKLSVLCVRWNQPRAYLALRRVNSLLSGLAS